MSISILGVLAYMAGSNTVAFKEAYLYLLIPVFVIISFIIGWKYGFKIMKIVTKWFYYVIEKFRVLIVNFKRKKELDIVPLEEVLKAAGYSYSPKQDIFYSNLDAWQREMGYCRLYDEAAAPLSMIIDCEPIYFEYDDKSWLIEFWKGQYGMTTGCEIGVYVAKSPDLNIPGVFNGTFYYSVGNENLLEMSFYLRKKGKTLFKRNGKHWWLTGFILGEFSNPSDLSMRLFINFKDNLMRNAFVEGLMNAGYSKKEIRLIRNTVGIKFDKPKTEQPYSRTKFTDKIMQKKNKLLCDKFQEITKEYDNSLDKIKAIQEQAPRMLGRVIDIGNSEGLFRKFKKIKKYLP